MKRASLWCIAAICSLGLLGAAAPDSTSPVPQYTKDNQLLRPENVSGFTSPLALG